MSVAVVIRTASITYVDLTPYVSIFADATSLMGLRGDWPLDETRQLKALSAEIDRQGRIVLPPLLRRDAGIGNRAMLVGQITRFDVWDQTAYEATRVGADQLANALKQIRR